MRESYENQKIAVPGLLRQGVGDLFDVPPDGGREVQPEVRWHGAGHQSPLARMSVNRPNALTPEQTKAYMEVLDRKTQRLKVRIDDLFEASKMSSGADGRKTWRVFENLITNQLKYAMPGTRVYIQMRETDGSYAERHL